MNANEALASLMQVGRVDCFETSPDGFSAEAWVTVFGEASVTFLLRRAEVTASFHDSSIKATGATPADAWRELLVLTVAAEWERLGFPASDALQPILQALDEMGAAVLGWKPSDARKPEDLQRLVQAVRKLADAP